MSKNYYIIPIFVPHEGCPHNCVFCNQVRITGVEKVEKENNKEEQGVNAKKVREIVLKKVLDNYVEDMRLINHFSGNETFGKSCRLYSAYDELEKKENNKVVRKRVENSSKI